MWWRVDEQSIKLSPSESKELVWVITWLGLLRAPPFSTIVAAWSSTNVSNSDMISAATCPCVPATATAGWRKENTSCCEILEDEFGWRWDQQTEDGKHGGGVDAWRVLTWRKSKPSDNLAVWSVSTIITPTTPPCASNTTVGPAAFTASLALATTMLTFDTTSACCWGVGKRVQSLRVRLEKGGDNDNASSNLNCMSFGNMETCFRGPLWSMACTSPPFSSSMKVLLYLLFKYFLDASVKKFPVCDIPYHIMR